MPKVICGRCAAEFTSDAKYLDHVCPVYGEKPTHPASMGPNHAEISNWTEQYRHIWEERFDRMDVYISELHTMEKDNE